MKNEEQFFFFLLPPLQLDHREKYSFHLNRIYSYKETVGVGLVQDSIETILS